MSVLPILTWPDPRLSRRCAPAVPGEAAANLARDMLETMYDAPGRGLAAPQVGHLVRLFVMDAGWKEGPRDPTVFLNPEITWRSDARVTGTEGCLSIPGITAEVERAEEIGVRWQDLGGVVHERRFDGFAAICIQHETDHLDGLVTFDRVGVDRRIALEAAYRGQHA